MAPPTSAIPEIPHLSALLAGALVAGAYLLGSIPFALLLGKARGVDMRTVGSGNIGATNLTRALGRRWGMTAFALDFLKGFLPAAAPDLLGAVGRDGVPAPMAGVACALAAILGHVFPVYLGFRGGKGVATSFGAVTALAPAAALAAGAVWLASYGITRTVSIASLAAAATFPLAMAAVSFYRADPAAVAMPLVTLAAVLSAVIVIRHRSNIRRLLAGKEGRF